MELSHREIVQRIDAAGGYLDLGMIENASRELEGIDPATVPDPRLFGLCIRTSAALGRLDQAMEQTDSAIRRFPNLPAFYFLKTDLLRIDGRPWEAKHALLGLPQTLREGSFFHLKMAECETDLGNHQAASIHREKARRMLPLHPRLPDSPDPISDGDPGHPWN